MRNPQLRLYAAVVLIMCFAVFHPAYADNSIMLRTQYPVQGERTELYVQDDTGTPVAGAAITATYRPGSSVEDTSAVGVTGKSGRVYWTPEIAGIVTLTAAWETATGESATTTTNVSVKFRSTPAGGVLIMILAGLLLVGGSAVRILRVLRSGE